MPSRLCHLSFLALMLLPTLTCATTYTWPGTAPCAGTLQACINGVADGNTIQIATNTPIAESPNLANRNLTLTAADGYAPNFGSNHYLNISSNSDAQTVSVSGLSFIDGYVSAAYNGSGTATYNLSQLTLTRASSNTANYIYIDANQGTVNATLYDNRVTGVPGATDVGMIQLDSVGATLNASVFYNHVTSTSAASVAGAGIFVNMNANGATPSAGTIKLHGNEVRGGFDNAGIAVSEGLSTSTASNFSASVYNNVSICANSSGAGTGGTGIGFFAYNGSINAPVINNTVSRCYYGIEASQWIGGGAGASISGQITNNLVVAYDGLIFDSLAGSLTNDYNLINASGNIGVTMLGSHTITMPANLVLDTQPRLRANSPAIDAADSSALAIGLTFGDLPTNDADGLRRFKSIIPGNSNLADIGAYEFGDVNFTHIARSNTIVTDNSSIDNATLNGNHGAVLIATPNNNIGLATGGVDYNHPFGAYYTGTNWVLLNQDESAMPLGAHFDVLVPAPGSGSFTAIASSIDSDSTPISDPSTDNQPGSIVLVTQNWTAGDMALYNPSPIGVFYNSMGDAKWHIANLDKTTMQMNLGFNVYAQQSSPNAWVVTAATGNLNEGPNYLRLDHPLLDNTSCARPQVTRLLPSLVISNNFELDYISGKWYIHAYDVIATGDQFEVLIDPAQVFDCTETIFADGFE